MDRGSGIFFYQGPDGEVYELSIGDSSLRIVYRDALGMNERVLLEGDSSEVLPLLYLARNGQLGREVNDISAFRALVEELSSQLVDIAADVATLSRMGRLTGWQVRSDYIVALADELEQMAAECEARGNALLSGKGDLMLDSISSAEELVSRMTERALDLNTAVVRLN